MGNLFTTENAEISDDFWKRRTQLYCMYCKRAFFIKARKYRRFGNVRIIICWHHAGHRAKFIDGDVSVVAVFKNTRGDRFVQFHNFNPFRFLMRSARLFCQSGCLRGLWTAKTGRNPKDICNFSGIFPLPFRRLR